MFFSAAVKDYTPFSGISIQADEVALMPALRMTVSPDKADAIFPEQSKQLLQ